jgi:hypothetical protein
LEERISKLPLGKGNKLKEGHGDFSREKGVTWVGRVFFFWERKKEEKECVISFFFVKGVVHERDVCKN